MSTEKLMLDKRSVGRHKYAYAGTCALRLPHCLRGQRPRGLLRVYVRLYGEPYAGSDLLAEAH
jgi:hypothetical protein